MNKRFLVIALVAALAGVSTASFAADGNFYVGADLGQSQVRVGGIAGEHLHKHDTAKAVRFGYVWHSRVDFGVEGGYVDLGKISDDYTYGSYVGRDTIKSSGLFGGAKVKYHLTGAWYVSARGGLFESHVQLKSHSVSPYGESSYDDSSTNPDWYAGVGVGYDFSRNFSLGLSYTNWRNKVEGDAASPTFNTAMFSLSAEYRF